ncbi:thioesterase family protein [Oceanivirga miroungae]|uniref:Fluoroacetyl-CoA thioesterase n=1 Tax=Oceanivirga miroungae TaxID=1130046 RepID=A0A6I8M8A9_9FUSO|nr:thioesterase family protein [Oceanivirga miroungae]VWL85044.1 Fluoroacetyl-CoA thioesterase [Oceanivirga miroungae]
MKEILVGSKYTNKMIVNEKDLASSYGSGLARVYATPAMIAFMEKTSSDYIAKFLENDEITVGIKVNIEHIKASPILSEVVCNVEIKEVSGKKIVLSVECLVNDEIIGKGIHERFVVNHEKFEKRVYEKK